MGGVFKQNFVNFIQYANYYFNTGYSRDINFTLKELKFGNYAK